MAGGGGGGGLVKGAVDSIEGVVDPDEAALLSKRKDHKQFSQWLEEIQRTHGGGSSYVPPDETPQAKALRFFKQRAITLGRTPWQPEYADEGFKRHGAAAPEGGYMETYGPKVLARPDLQSAPENTNQLPTMPANHQIGYSQRGVNTPQLPEIPQDARQIYQQKLNSGEREWGEGAQRLAFNRGGAADPGVGVGTSPLANQLRNLNAQRTV